MERDLAVGSDLVIPGAELAQSSGRRRGYFSIRMIERLEQGWQSGRIAGLAQHFRGQFRQHVIRAAEKAGDFGDGLRRGGADFEDRLRGPAADLWLVLMGRLDRREVDIVGDPAAADAWLDLPDW